MQSHKTGKFPGPLFLQLLLLPIVFVGASRKRQTASVHPDRHKINFDIRNTKYIINKHIFGNISSSGYSSRKLGILTSS
jgi:hypothetical protein